MEIEPTAIAFVITPASLYHNILIYSLLLDNEAELLLLATKSLT